MPSNHLILCHALLLLTSIFHIIRVFSNESALNIRWPKYWNFTFNISPSNELPGLISFRMDPVSFSVLLLFFFLMPSHFMGNRRGNRGKSVRLYFWGSKITADGDCSQEMKRLLGRKVMTNLDSILKSRDITLPIKVHLVKAMVFPVVMYGCKSWTVKKSEH